MTRLRHHFQGELLSLPDAKPGSLHAWAGGLIRYYEKPQRSAVIISALASALYAIRLCGAPTNDQFLWTDRSMIGNPDWNDSFPCSWARIPLLLDGTPKQLTTKSVMSLNVSSLLCHHLVFSCWLTKEGTAS